MTEKRRFSGKKDRKKRASFFPKKTLEKVVLPVDPRRYVAKKLEKPLFPSFLPTLRPALDVLTENSIIPVVGGWTGVHWVGQPLRVSLLAARACKSVNQMQK